VIRSHFALIKGAVVVVSELRFDSVHANPVEHDSCFQPHFPGSEACVAESYATLRSHPHFRGRERAIQISRVGDSLVIEGILPTFYLRQMLLSALKPVVNSHRLASLDMRVSVAEPVATY
jgi:hypothetical protein